MSLSARLVCVPRERVAAVWPFVVDRLHAAVKRTDLAHSADVDADVLMGHASLWLALVGDRIDAVATTLLVKTDANLVCVISAVGGENLRGWLPLLETLEAWAKAEGAAKVRIFGRGGWSRVLPSYTVENVVLERML